MLGKAKSGEGRSPPHFGYEIRTIKSALGTRLDTFGIRSGQQDTFWESFGHVYETSWDTLSGLKGAPERLGKAKSGEGNWAPHFGHESKTT